MAVHKVTFLPLNVTVEVDDEKYPLADHGKPRSLLDIALANHIHLEHNCGGSCACTTCHVIVKEGEENLSEMQPDEEDRLDMAEAHVLVGTAEAAASMFHTETVSREKRAHMPRTARTENRTADGRTVVRRPSRLAA